MEYVPEYKIGNLHDLSQEGNMQSTVTMNVKTTSVGEV
jgi:hypothetical protein